jgi:hypothetical protein
VGCTIAERNRAKFCEKVHASRIGRMIGFVILGKRLHAACVFSYEAMRLARFCSGK